MSANAAVYELAVAVTAALDERRRDLKGDTKRLAEAVDAYRCARGLAPGDRVDVVGGVPGTLGAPVADVVSTAEKSVVVRVCGEGRPRRLAPTDVRIGGADVVREARRMTTRQAKPPEHAGSPT